MDKTNIKHKNNNTNIKFFLHKNSNSKLFWLHKHKKVEVFTQSSFFSLFKRSTMLSWLFSPTFLGGQGRRQTSKFFSFSKTVIKSFWLLYKLDKEQSDWDEEIYNLQIQFFLSSPTLLGGQGRTRWGRRDLRDRAKTWTQVSTPDFQG